MHETFTGILEHFSIHPELVDILRERLEMTFHKANDSRTTDLKRLKDHRTILRDRLNTLETRYLDSMITQDTYQRQFSTITEELQNVQEMIDQTETKISNPKNFIDFSLKMMGNLPRMWENGTITVKKTLQKTVFPEGIAYHKKNRHYLTPKINSMFLLTMSITGGYKVKNQDLEIENLVILGGASAIQKLSNPHSIDYQLLKVFELKRVFERENLAGIY